MPHRLLALGLLPGVAIAAPQPAPTAQSADDLTGRLAAGVVTDTPPRVLYSWTTDDQLERLSQHRMLLTRTESPLRGQTGFALRIAQYAEQSASPTAKLLNRPGFARHRYAWSNPWATALGWQEETYGSDLIRVELKDEAWMAIFDVQAEPVLRFVDMKGQPVSEAEVLAHPERIGVVLHLKPQTWEPDPKYYTFGMTIPAYREYVLCNEGMIARWSHGGEAQRQVLADSRELLVDLRARLPEVAPSVSLEETWRQPPGDDPIDLYFHNLSLNSGQYWPTESALDTLIARLDAIAQDRAITHEPNFNFSLNHPPSVPGGVP
ncbi:MAG: hypothetical protein ACI8RZ_000883 [Myxococcota bacterium]